MNPGHLKASIDDTPHISLIAITDIPPNSYLNWCPDYYEKALKSKISFVTPLWALLLPSRILCKRRRSNGSGINPVAVLINNSKITAIDPNIEKRDITSLGQNKARNYYVS